MTTVSVLRDSASLAQIVPEWTDLVRHAVEPNPFYEPWMLLPALQWLDEGGALCCVAVWLEDGPARRLGALFPFHAPARYKGAPVAALSSYRHRHWLLCTPLIRAGRAQPCMEALLDWFARDGEGASLLEFRYVPCDGPAHSAIADALREREMMVIATDSFSRALLVRREDGDGAFEESLPRDMGRDLRRRQRRLAERGEVNYRVLRLEGEVEHWIDDFLRLEASGWKGRRGSALDCRDGDRRFARAIMASAFQRGQLMMVGVDLDRRPLARCCNFISGEGAFGFRIACDEAYAPYAPGVMAMVDSMRRFHAQRGLRWMDSLTDPQNTLLNRLYNSRRLFQTVLVGSGVLGELAVGSLPLVRWAKRRLSLGPKPAPARSGRERPAVPAGA
jgi:CelD/BcsL family acetyltransferase involved in cellulose biosynthesis